MTVDTLRMTLAMARDFNASGIPIEAVYDAVEATPHDLGEPGTFPYSRGIHAGMYRGRLWTMRQYAGFATAAESNARYRYLLERGQTGLSVAFDLPTQLGYDSDAPRRAARWARWASRSIRLGIWRRCSTESRSTV